VIVDSSGLKVCSQGEWHAQKHGENKVKRWKKLHIGVDDQVQIIASTVSESHEQDSSQVPELLDHIEGTSSAGAGSLAGLPVAQLDAGVGSFSVLSDQLKSGFKRSLRLLVDLRNKAGGM
jgi:hypothetical protein